MVWCLKIDGVNFFFLLWESKSQGISSGFFVWFSGLVLVFLIKTNIQKPKSCSPLYKRSTSQNWVYCFKKRKQRKICIRLHIHLMAIDEKEELLQALLWELDVWGFICRGWKNIYQVPPGRSGWKLRVGIFLLECLWLVSEPFCSAFPVARGSWQGLLVHELFCFLPAVTEGGGQDQLCFNLGL